jgi:hypothetical protein
MLSPLNLHAADGRVGMVRSFCFLRSLATTRREWGGKCWECEGREGVKHHLEEMRLKD